jgi:hypothetical protein
MLRTLCLGLALAPLLRAPSPPPGLRHHWRLTSDDFADGAFRDLAGDRGLRASAAPTFFGDRQREALKLAPGAPALVVDAAFDPAELPRRAITVEAWVAIDAPAPWGGILSAVEDNGDHERGWVLGYRNDRLLWGLTSESKQRITYLSSKMPFRRGQWHHVAGTYDGEWMRLYVDGALSIESQEQNGPVLYDAQHAFAAGAFKDKDEDYRLIGALYEVRLWDRAQSARDIERRYARGRDDLPAITGDSVSDVRLKSVAELQPEINRAIDEGVAHLLRRQHRDGSWETHLETYRNGGTALAVYTLLKSGVPASHPAVVRGLDFLAQKDPTRTYSAACQLLALAALGDARHMDWAQRIVDDLIDWENTVHKGAWGYPAGNSDFSNTQYAALGLWAAWKLGIKVPKELWQRMVVQASDGFQSASQEADWAPGEKRSGKRKLAGYSYHVGQENPTGSMTTAGLGVLQLAQICTGGKLGHKYTKLAEKSALLGLEWMDLNYSVTSNPNGGWYYYYLYGLERVGSLYETETIGKHEWYRDGAEQLVAKQNDEGSWGAEPDTCFALLFLARATAPKSGAKAQRQAAAWQLEAGPVHLRCTGDMRLTAWITGFEQSLLDQHEQQSEPQKKGLRVVKVQYFLNDVLMEEAQGDARTAWTINERLPTQLRAPNPGKQLLRAEVHVVPLGEYPDSFKAATVHRSDPLEVFPERRPEEFISAAHEAYAHRNLIADLAVSLTASTSADERSGPEKAADNLQATRWACAKDDADPWLRLELERPPKANTVLISPADSSLVNQGHFGRVMGMTITINNSAPVPVEPSHDPLMPSVFTLPRTVPVRSIELHITDRRPGRSGTAGFAEIALEER